MQFVSTLTRFKISTPFSRLRRGSENSRCVLASKECHAVSLSNGRHCAAGAAPRHSHTIQRNGEPSWCSAGHRHETWASFVADLEISGWRDLNPRPLEPHSSVLPS